MIMDNKFVYALIFFLGAMVVVLGSTTYYLMNERDYYKRTTYDPQRFAVLAPVIKATLQDMGEVARAESTYISLFHNGLNWLAEGLHPPFVNEVFSWDRGVAITDQPIPPELQNIPIDTIPKIYETLQGSCVGIKLNDGSNTINVDLRCPLRNQRNEVVGYYGAILKDVDLNNINRYLTVIQLYQSRIGDILFKE